MQLIDKDKCLKQIMNITEDIEHSNPNIKFRFLLPFSNVYPQNVILI